MVQWVQTPLVLTMGIKERWSGFKPLPRDIMERIGQLKPLFERHGVRLAYVFGSLAEGRPANDVDLAILPDKWDFFEMYPAITEILGTERLDLVNLKTAPPLLRFEVISTGKLIYKTDDDTENDFEMSVIREYHDTAHLRARQNETLRERTAQWLSRKN